jgi:hypothetical protein
MMKYPSAHGGGGFAISHRDSDPSNVVDLAAYRDLRAQQFSIFDPWQFHRRWVLGLRAWNNCMRDAGL